jgi:methylmalonyl-CoA/ethylmalonyl-CoA epimerase
MIRKLIHVGIAVRNLESSAALFAKLLGTREAGREEVYNQRVKVAFFHVDGGSVELTEATSPDSPIARFIEKRGEGVHHLSFEVDDIESELQRLQSEGFRLVDDKPRVGAGGYLIAFLHPQSTNGVLIEISQKQKA